MKLRIDKKELWENVKYIMFGIVFAVLFNKLMGLILHTDLPIVAVMTGSMVHDSTTPYRHYQFLKENFGYTKEQIDSWPIKNGFRPGDVLIIKGVPEDELKVGDIIVFTYEGQPVPIIHRIVFIDKDGYPYTKGDHNPVIDPDCRLLEKPIEGCWKRTSIKGKAIFWIPFLGIPKLILQTIINTIRGVV